MLRGKLLTVQAIFTIIRIWYKIITTTNGFQSVCDLFKKNLRYFLRNMYSMSDLETQFCAIYIRLPHHPTLKENGWSGWGIWEVRDMVWKTGMELEKRTEVKIWAADGAAVLPHLQSPSDAGLWTHYWVHDTIFQWCIWKKIKWRYSFKKKSARFYQLKYSFC